METHAARPGRAVNQHDDRVMVQCSAGDVCGKLARQQGAHLGVQLPGRPGPGQQLGQVVPGQQVLEEFWLVYVRYLT
jgi:hypothetical protein